MSNRLEFNPPAGRRLLHSAEVLFTPADFETLPGRDLSRTTCVVFDVLRATTSMVIALANGAAAVIPVAGIGEALTLRRQWPEVLLAGERDGVRIRAAQTGGVDFDLGNSPREFTADKVRGRTIVTTTTNGTRALRACAGAQATLVGSFPNLGAVAGELERRSPQDLIVVCSGTVEQAAYEDVLGAGALLDLIERRFAVVRPADSVHLARQAWSLAQANPFEAVQVSRNARKLLGHPDLAGDVPFCLQRNTVNVVAVMERDGTVRQKD